MRCVLVSPPDLIRHVYRFQYNACAGVGFGPGTETGCVWDI